MVQVARVHMRQATGVASTSLAMKARRRIQPPRSNPSLRTHHFVFTALFQRDESGSLQFMGDISVTIPTLCWDGPCVMLTTGSL
jgi:hypothetical protein